MRGAAMAWPSGELPTARSYASRHPRDTARSVLAERAGKGWRPFSGSGSIRNPPAGGAKSEKALYGKQGPAHTTTLALPATAPLGRRRRDRLARKLLGRSLPHEEEVEEAVGGRSREQAAALHSRLKRRAAPAGGVAHGGRAPVGRHLDVPAAGTRETGYLPAGHRVAARAAPGHRVRPTRPVEGVGGARRVARRRGLVGPEIADDVGRRGGVGRGGRGAKGQGERTRCE